MRHGSCPPILDPTIAFPLSFVSQQLYLSRPGAFNSPGATLTISERVEQPKTSREVSCHPRRSSVSR